MVVAILSGTLHVKCYAGGKPTQFREQFIVDDEDNLKQQSRPGRPVDVMFISRSEFANQGYTFAS